MSWQCDASRCALVLVTLDEPVVRDESARLVHEVRDRGVGISGIILNRASEAPANKK